jgi:hypothetical protein
MAMPEKPNPIIDRWRTAFRWATYIGFWWSLANLLYGMRTPRLALDELAHVFSVVTYVLTPLYYVWHLIRGAFVFVTAPIYSVLQLHLGQDVRDSISFGFFVGARVSPMFSKRMERWGRRMGDLEMGAVIFGAAVILLSIPYLLVCDLLGRWVPLETAFFSVLAFVGAYGAGSLLWLSTDPFDFVTKPDAPESRR